MAIFIRDLSFKFDTNDTPILDNLNLEIGDNETLALLGVSGSGKSTLFNLITSFHKPTTGSISFKNIPIEKIAYIRQSAMGMVFPWKNVQENIEFALKERNQFTEKNKQRLDKLIYVLRLDDKKKQFPSELSGGELKRLSFACALSYSPRLILLDEAFTGIDFSLKWELWSFLKTELKTLNATAIIVTHDFDEAIFLADKIIFLNSKKRIDDRKVVVRKSEVIDIEKTLSSEEFNYTKVKTLKTYKEINETT